MRGGVSPPHPLRIVRSQRPKSLKWADGLMQTILLLSLGRINCRYVPKSKTGWDRQILNTKLIFSYRLWLLFSASMHRVCTGDAPAQMKDMRHLVNLIDITGAPGRIRTSDRRIRSPLLCPLSYRRGVCSISFPDWKSTASALFSAASGSGFPGSSPLPDTTASA